MSQVAPVIIGKALKRCPIQLLLTAMVKLPYTRTLRAELAVEFFAIGSGIIVGSLQGHLF